MGLSLRGYYETARRIVSDIRATFGETEAANRQKTLPTNLPKKQINIKYIEQCNACGGLGYHLRDVPCRICKGTGYLKG